MEFLIDEVARKFIEYVDDRYGRIAAWGVALFGTAVVMGLAMFLVVNLIR